MTTTAPTTSPAGTAISGGAGSNPGEVDTYDWDTSFAIRYSDANAAVTAGWPTVQDDAKSFEASVDGYTLSGTLGPWQLVVGGDGRNVWMHLPVLTGSFAPPGGGATTDLSGATFEVEINLTYVPDPASTTTHQLVADPAGDATTVRAVTGVTLDPIVTGIVKELANTWLGSHLAAFNHVFHDLDLSQDVDKDSTWAFITPTSVSYAVTDSGTMDTSVFGVLTMTAGRTAPTTLNVRKIVL